MAWIPRKNGNSRAIASLRDTEVQAVVTTARVCGMNPFPQLLRAAVSHPSEMLAAWIVGRGGLSMKAEILSEIAYAGGDNLLRWAWDHFDESKHAGLWRAICAGQCCWPQLMDPTSPKSSGCARGRSGRRGLSASTPSGKPGSSGSCHFAGELHEPVLVNSRVCGLYVSVNVARWAIAAGCPWGEWDCRRRAA